MNCSVTLRPGNNVIVLQATNTLGNVASASILVTLQAAPTSIAIVPATRVLAVGDTAMLQTLDNAGVSVTNAVWTNSNPSVATIDSNGSLTAAGIGQATLTATTGSLSAQATVTVYAAGALPTGTVRWAVNPLPNMSAEQMVGVSQD